MGMKNLKITEGKKLLNHANNIFKKMDPNRKSTKERYQHLDKIINFLYNRLGIKRPKQTGILAMAMQVGKATAHKKPKKDFKKMNPLELSSLDSHAISAQTSDDIEDSYVMN